MDNLLDEFYCSDCGNPSDGEICERCKAETIDWNKQDRRWNGRPFWQDSTQIAEYRVPEKFPSKVDGSLGIAKSIVDRLMVENYGILKNLDG